MAAALEQRSSEIRDISVSLSTEHPHVHLRPEVEGTAPENYDFLWHSVPSPEGVRIQLTSHDSKLRVLKLRVESADPDFKSKWVVWTVPHRQASELSGGSALEAHDKLLGEGTQAQILLQAGESRTLTLSFAAKLDGETPTGVLRLSLIVTDNDDPKQLEEIEIFLQLSHPASMFLDAMPAIYKEEMAKLYDRENPTALPFFERYLRGFEDSFEAMQSTLDLMDRFFSPLTTPSSFLLWLSNWVVLAPSDVWPEMRRRRLVQEAVELYRWRGTARGLKRYIEVCTGYEPVIEDIPVEGWRLGAHAKLGSDQTVLGDLPPHTFVVKLYVPDPEAIDRRQIENIVRNEKPAHTAFSLYILKRSEGSK